MIFAHMYNETQKWRQKWR